MSIMKKNIYRIIKKCRICQKDSLFPVLHIKAQYIASNLVKSNKDNLLSKTKIPLTLVLCSNCSLVQLRETVAPDLLFQNYFYRSSVNKTMRDNLRDVVSDVLKKAKLKKDDYVVDIGSNDCIMLTYFPKRLRRIGVEPAKNIDWSNIDKSIKIVNDYFSKEEIFKITQGKKIKAITAIAMFYDLDDPNFVCSEIKEILAEDGVLCIQVSYLYSTVRDANFYDICHEHLEYYSLKSLEYLLSRNNMRIFDASLNNTNGGSIRIFATHSENKKPLRSNNVDRLQKMEDKMELEKVKTYKRFKIRIKQLAKWVKKFLSQEVKKGGFVVGLGASTKGNVMLQICAIDKRLLPFISDRNKSKIGYRTLGTDMEVISEVQARNLKPSLMLVSPWYFKDEILRREKKYIDRGGRLLFIMPYPYILDKRGEKRIKV